MADVSDGKRASQGGARVRPRQLVDVTPQGFLFNPTDGESYTVNRVGACLMRALLDGEDSREAWRAVAERFDVDERTARRDAEDFLARLRELDLLEPIPDEEVPAAEQVLRAAAGPSDAP